MKVNPSNFFKSVAQEPDQFYVIHYSSQSLYDADSEGHSPRITSIAVMHFATRQTTSFSVHAVADLLRIGKDEVETRYNDIEKEMLLRFFEFVRDRLDKYWIHWRMQNLTYGFEHLEHRSRLLGNPDPPRVPFENRLDLSAILQVKYGSDYVPNPRMINLATAEWHPSPRVSYGRARGRSVQEQGLYPDARLYPREGRFLSPCYRARAAGKAEDLDKELGCAS